jgi:anti-sigma regulatory factor (Ser/Thr protein kinase)
MAIFQTQIRFPSNPCYLQVVREMISGMGLLAGLPESKVRLITLAVDEACANIIRHTYKNEPSHIIEMTSRISEDQLEFCLKDFGEKMDLGKIRHRDLDDVRPGGLGTFFMKNIMDKIEYEHVVPRGNLVRLTKFLSQDQSE